MKELRTEIEINAPAERVWQILTDPAHFSDWNPFIHMPAGLGELVKIEHINCGYNTEPERELQGRQLYWPRGK